MRRATRIGWIKSLTLLTTLVVAAFATWSLTANLTAQEPDDPEVLAAPMQHAKQLSRAFRTAAKETLPAVVTVQQVFDRETAQASPRQRLPEGFDEEMFKGTPFEDFFKNREDLFEQLPSPRRRSGTGTGFIIDPAGIILTNNHVVSGGGKVKVRLHDGREFEAAKVRTDPRTDLAVIWIEGAGELPAAKLGDSDKLEIGDWVIAVGNPFGLSETVTAGIISAKSRGIGVAQREDFLQTDAAINPGNSGGPLVSLDGKVVGINTAISSRTGGYQGVGFAIPINLAKWVANQLIESGSVKRAYLGIAIQPVTPELAERLGVDAGNGALVSQVMADSPAAEAGLEAGDVIVQFDGKQIESPRDLVAAAEVATIGEKHPVTVVRDGTRKKFNVVMKQQPKDFGLRRPTTSTPPEGATFEDLGLEIGPLSEEAAQELELKAGTGVEVPGVVRGSPAGAAGLEPGMVISQVNRHEVNSVKEFRRALKKSSLEEGVLLLVHSSGGARFVVLQSK